MRLLPLVLVLGCEPIPGAGDDSDSDRPNDREQGTLCTLDPQPADSTVGLRVGADGALWLTDLSGTLYRYERQAGEGCALSGEAVWTPEDFNSVTDFEIDAAGKVYLLVFFSTLVRLDASGAEELRCEVPQGHALAVKPDGSAILTIPLGSETASWVPVGADACGEAGSPITFPHKLGTAPVALEDSLAVDAHDSTGTLAPASIFDADTGALIRDIGTGVNGEGGELEAIADLAALPDGRFLAAADISLWTIGADGGIEAWTEARYLLPAETEYEMLTIPSVGWSPDTSYVAGGFLDFDGVWAFEDLED